MARVALVVLDTLRKDRFDRYFDWLPGIHFENAYSTANWTAPAHASLFTGYYGSEVGVSAKSRDFDSETLSLPEVLSDSGYRTRGLSANHNVSTENNFDRGFNEFVGPSELFNPDVDSIFKIEEFTKRTECTGIKRYTQAVKEIVFGSYDTIDSLRYGIAAKFQLDNLTRSVDDDGASTVLDYVREQHWEDDEFLFVNLMEAHTPYNPPEEYKTVNNSVTITLKDTFEGVDDPERVKTAYDSSAAYLSDVYKDIFEELSEEFDYVITLADHGEMLGEHDLWNHTYGLYPEVTHVPLVISSTNDSGQSVNDSPVSLLDVHKTILDITGREAPSRGQSLLEGTEPRDTLLEYRGLISIAKRRLEDSGVSAEQIEEYDSDLSALSGRNLSYSVFSDGDVVYSDGSTPDDALERLEQLEADLDTDNQISDSEDEEFSDEVLSRLEDLGYA